MVYLLKLTTRQLDVLKRCLDPARHPLHGYEIDALRATLADMEQHAIPLDGTEGQALDRALTKAGPKDAALLNLRSLFPPE